MSETRGAKDSEDTEKKKPEPSSIFGVTEGRYETPDKRQRLQ